MVMTASPAKASRGDPTGTAPSMAFAASGERFHTPTRWPALTRFSAMAAPMLPSPMKPISIVRLPMGPGDAAATVLRPQRPGAPDGCRGCAPTRFAPPILIRIGRTDP